jgi:hypothetical protein
MACELTIRRGANVWLLARTDADSPTPEEVMETTAAYLVRTLGAASPGGTRSPFETVESPAVDPSTPGVRRYYIGAARPVEITVSQTPVIGLPGTPYARREDCPEPALATVEAERPWYCVVEFDWRAPSTKIPWPRRRVNWLGIPSDEGPYHWLLLQANHVGDVQHDDSSLVKDVAAKTSEWWDDAVRVVKRELARVGQPLQFALIAGVALGVLILAAKARR